MDNFKNDPFAGMQGMATQMFEAWQKAAGSTGMGAAGATTDPSAAFRQGVELWSSLARQAGAGPVAGDINDAVERFASQGGPWLGMMQQLAGQFGGAQGSAADISKAWQSMVESMGANPLNDMLKHLPGGGANDFSKWMADAGPMLGLLNAQMPDWTEQPAFGFAREHQERLQRLGAAWRENQSTQQAYDKLMLDALRNAFPIFEGKLAEHSEPGRQLDSARALFDLWIDSAEEAYAEMALSDPFRHAYAQMVNAQMRLRQALQGELALSCRAMGMPTRAEVDAGHQRLHALEREVRRLRRELAGARPVATAGRGEAAAANPPAGRTVEKKATGARKSAASKAAPEKAARKEAASKKSASRKAGTKKAAPRKAAAKGAGQKKAPAKKTASRRAAPRKSAAAKKSPAAKKTSKSPTSRSRATRAGASRKEA